MNLSYSYMEAQIGCGINEHAQKVMESLGIKYEWATPQTMGDCWWFWNCSNVPDTLPTYLQVLDVLPKGAVGWGLSQEQANKLTKEV